MRIICTGGAGLIGSHLTEALFKLGHEVIVYDDLSTGKVENLPDDTILIEKDIRDYDSLVKAFKDADYVFHLAAIPQVMYSIDHPEKTHNVNINGTLNVLRAAKVSNIKKVIFASSSAVYGDSGARLKEDMKLNPQNPYALQKATGEMYCKLYNDIYNLPTISLRFFNVWGPRQNPDSSYSGVVSRFTKAKKEGKPLEIVGDGTQSRDFIHVSDVVSALIKAMEKDVQGLEINIGSGRATTVLELSKVFGGEVTFLPDRGEVKQTLADITLANALLNWYPKVTFETGLYGD